MRDLKRNQKEIWYALYQNKIPKLDLEGNDTGEFTKVYGNPLKTNISVSASKGESESNAFGASLDYDRIMTTHDKSIPIDEYSRLWIDIKPVIVEGATETKHDYNVKKVATSINNTVYAIKRA